MSCVTMDLPAFTEMEKPCCRSALDVLFKGRLSPPDFLERRVPALGNTFVSERGSAQAKRCHSRGICCSGKASVEVDSKLEKVAVPTEAEPVCGFICADRPESPVNATNHMAQLAAQTSESVYLQRMVESPTLPAVRQQTKHVIALSQLLDQASEHQVGNRPVVRSIALDGLVITDEVARCVTRQTPICTSGTAFGNMSVDVTSVVSVADTEPCKGVTLIVRNIPRHILQEQILMQLRNDGFSFGTGHLDLALIYAPAVFGGHLGKPQGQGFGFVHANSSDAARAFMARWHRRHVFGTAREVRALDVSKAHVQGVQANLAQWSQTKTRRIRNSRFQPYVADGILAVETSTD